MRRRICGNNKIQIILFWKPEKKYIYKLKYSRYSFCEKISFNFVTTKKNMWRVGPDFKPLTQVLIEFYSTPCANIMTKPGSSIMSSVICWFSHDMTTTACFPEKVMKYSFVKQLLWFCWSRLIWRTQFVTFFMSVCLSVYTSALYGC